MACFVFALLAVPLGARPRRGGRASGFLVTLILICGYYLAFITGAGLARQGRLSPALGLWAANLLTGMLGLLLLPGMEHPHEEGWLARIAESLATWRRSRRAPASAVPFAVPNGLLAPQSSTTVFRIRRARGFPQLIDLYILRSFLFYFSLLLVGFILLFEAFTFFE